MPIGRRHLKLVGLILLVCCAIISPAHANHPFHVSTAEVEFNVETKRLEVALKCQTTDLERALRLMAGKKIDIENDPKVDELLIRYVTENFYLAVAPPIVKSEAVKSISEIAPSRDLASQAVPSHSISCPLLCFAFQQGY